VVDVQFLEALAEPGEDVGHPGDEGLTVVAHEVQRLPAELEALVKPLQDGRSLGVGVNSQADDEAGVVVHEPNDPSLDVAAGSQPNEERAFDVHVPQLIGATSFVPRPALAHDAAASTAAISKEPVYEVVPDPVDLTALHLSRDPLGIPVGE